MTAKDSESGFIENPFFDRREFCCSCGCGYAVVDARLLELLTAYRIYFDAPMIITSGARCLKHNAHVGGAAPKLDADHQPIWGTGSQHLWGKAADFKVKGYKPEDVFQAFDACMEDWGGLGLYSSWVHVDVRDEKARWGH